MLCKIAWSNIRRASRDYLVYFVTLTLAVTVFYSFNTISVQADFLQGDPREMVKMLGGILAGLTVFLAFVMGFLMVYANNFIMRRRKREFGLYQILGMSRGQVSRIMAYETFIVSMGAFLIGLVLGIALSWLMVFFTGALFQTQISSFRFFVSPVAIMLTVGCLVLVFFLSLILNLIAIRRSKVIDLVSASRRNEGIKTRNALVSAIIFVIGAVLVAVSYARLLHDGLPYDGDPALENAFIVTTVMVCVGTIMLFFGLSGFLLKVLQAWRGLYYRNLNMFTLRQLSAKVNTVSASMAIISMILFLAITSVTTGMSICASMNENLEQHTPFSYSMTVVYYGSELLENGRLEGPVAQADEPADIYTLVKDGSRDVETGEPANIDLARVSDKMLQVDVYDSRPKAGGEPIVSLQELSDLTGMPLPKGISGANTGLAVMRESDYNRLMAFQGYEEIDLGENRYLITCDMGDTVTSIYNSALEKGVVLNIGDRDLEPAADSIDIRKSALANSTMGINAGTIVLPDDLIDELDLPLYTSYLNVQYAPDIDVAKADAYVRQGYVYPSVLDDAGNEVGGFGMATTRTEAYESSSGLTGIVSYMAIYIGFVLVVACAAILTIQQLSGVADAGQNYRILSELGTAAASINHSVLLQQAIFFAFPLVVGAAHSMVALRVVIDLVQLFGNLSIGGMVGLTCVVFGVAYGGYFLVTYLMSKGIVRDAIRARHTV